MMSKLIGCSLFLVKEESRVVPKNIHQSVITKNVYALHNDCVEELMVHYLLSKKRPMDIFAAEIINGHSL